MLLPVCSTGRLPSPEAGPGTTRAQWPVAFQARRRGDGAQPWKGGKRAPPSAGRAGAGGDGGWRRRKAGAEPGWRWGGRGPAARRGGSIFCGRTGCLLRRSHSWRLCGPRSAPRPRRSEISSFCPVPSKEEGRPRLQAGREATGGRGRFVGGESACGRAAAGARVSPLLSPGAPRGGGERQRGRGRAQAERWRRRGGAGTKTPALPRPALCSCWLALSVGATEKFEGKACRLRGWHQPLSPLQRPLVCQWARERKAWWLCPGEQCLPSASASGHRGNPAPHPPRPQKSAPLHEAPGALNWSCHNILVPVHFSHWGLCSRHGLSKLKIQNPRSTGLCEIEFLFTMK
jgi:hypothetical protein